MTASPSLGILLTNTGTPDQPTERAVRSYLREFLSDRRVVQIPRIIWLPILYGLILPFRSKRSAKLYQEIWTDQGSPMRASMQHLRNLLEKQLNGTQRVEVEVGMNYGNPSIQQGLENLRSKQVDEIIILPLFPQYSHTTTASTYDRVAQATRKWPSTPAIRRIDNYAGNKAYIHALAESVRQSRATHGTSELLLISFHGIPERFVAAGDPYESQCQQTAKLLADALGLSANQWQLCYQSQFGYDKWLKPSTQALLQELPQQGIKNIDIICPGFSVDCLETLEEIAITGKKSFQSAGGTRLHYIPALNESSEHAIALSNILLGMYS